MSAIPLGRFVWYQLNSTDMDAAKDFYTDIVGWDTEAWTGGDDPYVMFKRGEVPVGGLMRIPPAAQDSGAVQHWLGYISTPDVDKTVLSAIDQGATVMVPATDLPEVGRFAVLADPHGAIFAPYAPTPVPDDTPFDPALGDASWHELIAADHAVAFDFYHALFDWDRTEAMDMGEMGTYQMFGRGGKTLGGMYTRTADMPPPHWLIYFRVSDVNACVARISERGGKVLRGPMEVPGGDLVAQCQDPQGGVFAIHSTV